MSVDDRETNEEREAREIRQDEDSKKAWKEQNKTNEEARNNTGLLRDIQSRQCDVLEKLGEMKVTIQSIEEHTSVMNNELGSCKEDIKTAKEDIKELKGKFILKLSGKQMVTIIGATSTLVTIIYTLLKIFVFKL
jgi:chromosome segregation ATPase